MRALPQALACPHHPMEDSMTLDTIMALIAVTLMFATVAVVLGSGHKANKG
jgi:hypothetical protein